MMLATFDTNEDGILYLYTLDSFSNILILSTTSLDNTYPYDRQSIKHLLLGGQYINSLSITVQDYKSLPFPLFDLLTTFLGIYYYFSLLNINSESSTSKSYISD